MVQTVSDENAAQKISKILEASPDVGVMVKKIMDVYSVISSDETLDKKLRCIFNGLPQLFRFPDNLRIMIQMDDFKFSSKDFKEEKCKLSASIIVHGKSRGKVVVCYSEPVDHSGEISFNEYERMILRFNIESLGLATERKEDEGALMDSEELYRLLFNTSKDAVLMLAFDSLPKPVKVIDANDRALELLGYSREELKKLTLADVSHMASVHRSRDAMKKTLSEREGKFETAMTTKDGRVIPLEINASIFEYKGEPVTLCVLRDLSEQRLTESVLRDTETKLRTISENMMDLISEVDMTGVFTYASPSHFLVLGYEPGDLIGKSIFSLLHPIDADRMKAIVIDSVGKSEFGKLEVRFKHIHGFYIWLEVIGKLRFDKKGFPVSAVLTGREITDRKKIETELKAERDFSSAVIDVAQTMVIVFDATGRIEKFNRASEAVTGHSSEDAVGRNFLELFAGSLPGPNIEDGKRAFAELLSEAQPIHHESRWLRKDGSPLIVSWSAIAITDDHQRVQHIIVTGMDVTDRRLAEESLRERLKLEGLLNRISAEAVIVDDLERFLDGSLKDMGETMGASRAFLIEFDLEKKTMTQTHEWVAQGCPIDSHLWQDVPFASVPMDYDTMMREEIVAFEDVERDHYDPLLKEMLLKENVRALLSVPVTLGEEPYGLIGFDVIGRTRKWKKEDIDLVIAIARIVGQVIEREVKEEIMAVKDSAIEMATNAIAFANPEGKITYVNENFFRNTKFKSKDEVIGRSFSEFFANPQDVRRIVADLQRSGSIITEVDAKRADGSIVRVELTGTALKDENGKIKMFVGSTIDISKRKLSKPAK
jgi:PAS domain S-box-containing protein